VPALSRKSPNARHSRESGNPLPSVLTWTPAFAGVTTLAIFIPLGGPKAQRPSVEGSRQQGEIRLGEFLSPPEQPHDNKEISIGKKRTPEFRHRDRIRHGGDNSYGKDADRKSGGPRYLLKPARSAVREPMLSHSYN
jgi:hypothetical protein